MIVKPYPKDNEPRTLKVSQDLLGELSARIAKLGLGRDDLLFPSREPFGGPLSRATFNKRYWKPAVERSGIDFNMRMHDLRHSHASWLLAELAPTFHRAAGVHLFQRGVQRVAQPG